MSKYITTTFLFIYLVHFLPFVCHDCCRDTLLNIIQVEWDKWKWIHSTYFDLLVTVKEAEVSSVLVITNPSSSLFNQSMFQLIQEFYSFSAILSACFPPLKDR